MKGLLVLTLVSLNLVLVACGDKNNDSGGGSSSPVPQEFQTDMRSKMGKSKPLSKEFSEELSKMSKNDRELLPDLRFIYGDFKNWEERQTAEKKLNTTGLAVLAKAKEKCTASVKPMQEAKDLQVGVPQTNTSSKSISGAECPISVTESGEVTTLLTSVDQNSNQATGSATMRFSSSEEVVDPTLKQAMAIVKKDLSVKGTVLVHSAGESSSMYMKMGIDGKVVQADGHEAKVTGDVEMVMSSGALKIQLLVSIDYKKETVVLGMFMSGDKEEFYINNKLATGDELTALLGSDPTDLVSNLKN